MEIFAFPERAYLFLGVLLVLFLIWRSGRIRLRVFKKWKLDDTEASAFREPINRPLKNFLLILGLLLGVVSYLGPQWGQNEEAMQSEGLDLCLALDLSKSMLAEDVSPSRLQLIKDQLSLFLPKLSGDRATVVAFAGAAYTVAPLSADYAALVNFIDPLHPSFISNQSTYLGSAVEACLNSLKIQDLQSAEELVGEASKVIMIVTDGESTDSGDGSAFEKAQEINVPIFFMGVGSSEGAPIPEQDEAGNRSYVMDAETGSKAITKFNREAIEEIADENNGKVFYAEEGLTAWNSFLDALKNFDRSQKEFGNRLFKKHRFMWFLVCAFILLLLEFVITECRFNWRKDP